jgi:dihydrofolate reductase
VSSQRRSTSCSAARLTRCSPRTALPRRRRSHGGIAKLFNHVKKYVVSRSGEVDTSWAGSVLLRDITDVKRLKQEDGPNLVTQGSTELAHGLLAYDLVDAMSIFTVPVMLGGGKKLFADGSVPHSFKLTRSRVSPNGLIVGHYEREGEIKIGDTTLDSPSERESARRKRMKREGERCGVADGKPLLHGIPRGHGLPRGTRCDSLDPGMMLSVMDELRNGRTCNQDVGRLESSRDLAVKEAIGSLSSSIGSGTSSDHSPLRCAAWTRSCSPVAS